MEKRRIAKRILCFVTGGHKYLPWKCRFSHEIDGLYSVVSTCEKCGYKRQDIVPLKVNKWDERIEEVRRYDGK